MPNPLFPVDTWTKHRIQSRGSWLGKLSIGTGKLKKITYDRIFGHFMTDHVTSITVRDPYLISGKNERNQNPISLGTKVHIINLIDFIEMCYSLCPNSRNLWLVSSYDIKTDPLWIKEVMPYLKCKKPERLEVDGIEQENLHDRSIIFRSRTLRLPFHSAGGLIFTLTQT